MVHPPSVDYPLAHPGFLSGMLWVIWLAVISIDLGWLLSANAADWRPWFGLVVTAVCGLFAFLRRPLTRSGSVTWDASEWWWDCQGRRLSGRIAVRLDIQSALLIRFVSGDGAGHWLWLDRKSLPARWLSLRRAVQAAGARHADALATAAERDARP
jgi:hypothetical protein